MSTNERHPITESLTDHAQPLARLMTSGRDYGMQYLPSLRMEKPVSYDGEAYNYIRLGRLLSLETSGRLGDDLLHFSPMMSIHVHLDPDQQVGLITDINYAQFGLASPYFEGEQPDIPIGRFLLSESFEVAIGDGKDGDMETLVSNGTFNSADEFGDVAQAAVQSIVAAAAVLQRYSLDELHDMYER